ncbi:MAG: AmmeMemoRadiSam system protein A [Candidatus Limnocylindrales bacterium]
MQDLLSLDIPAPRGGCRPPAVSSDVQRSLLELARAALAVAVEEADQATLGRAIGQPEGSDQRAAVFVTLTEHGDLRGCIGTLDADRSLREAVVAATLNAALGDPRFLPVTATELPAIEVGISVLGPPVPIVDPADFTPGVDGVTVERDGRRALLLPEVATEFAWGTTQMFDNACRKAGLPAAAWQDGRTRLSAFRTIRFSGPAVPDGAAVARSG